MGIGETNEVVKTNKAIIRTSNVDISDGEGRAKVFAKSQKRRMEGPRPRFIKSLNLAIQKPFNKKDMINIRTTILLWFI